MSALPVIPLLAFAAAAQGAVPAFEETVAIRRVHLPVILEPASAGGCDGVTAEAITVLEDGLPLPALRLDDEALPAEHALLLDSSASMLDRLQATKAAVLTYVDGLRADEPAMFATFDEDLLMHCPMTRDRERFRERVETASIGWGTHLWDGLRQMIDYLAWRDGRAVLIVVTDGCDTEPTPSHGPAELLDRLSRVSGLTLYSVGLQLPGRCGPRGSDPRDALRLLAGATGGSHLDIASAAEMPTVLAHVRQLLRQERTVSYDPPRFGAGPKDRADKQPGRWRRIRVKLDGFGDCRVRPAASPARYETRTGGGMPRSDTIVYNPLRGVLQASLDDVTRDSGRLASRGESALAPRIRSEARRKVSRRRVEALVPPLRRLVWPGALPEYAVFDALMQLTPDAALAGLPPLTAGLGSWTEVPFLVHGRTLLEQRGALGRALADHPGLRRWATEKLRRARLSELERLGAELGSDEQRSALDSIREHVLGDAWRPEPDAFERVLGEWLADLPALRVHRAAESWLVKRLLLALRRDPGRFGPGSHLTEAERIWADLGVLFAEQRETRLLGLLVPGYDPQRDVVGFYRIVLPRPTTLVNVWHLSRDAPRGVRLLAWAMRDRTVRHALIDGGFDVETVRYEPEAADSGEVLSLGGATAPAEERPSTTLGVEVRLRRRTGAGTQRLGVGAIFAFREFAGVPVTEPLCLVLEEPDGGDPQVAYLVRALAEHKRRHAVPCVIDAARR